MRTSHSQYVMMVEFMEANGDLSHPSGGSRDRYFIQMKWKELTNKLNTDGAGELRSEEKWRKVWSDLKNNIKRKCAKINGAAGGTDGGPAPQLSLTALETRVMQIVEVQAAMGVVVEEAGSQQDEISEISQVKLEKPETPEVPLETEWSTPGTSAEATEVLPPTEAHPPSPVSTDEECQRAPPQKKQKTNLIKMFLDSERKAREYARECDIEYVELQKERLRNKSEELRVREFEVQERVRQRDAELWLQGQWLELMKEGMDVFLRYMGKK